MKTFKVGMRAGSGAFAWIFNNITWYFAQLLPFWWHSVYQANDTTYAAWWRMWMGIIYCYTSVEVKKIIMKNGKKENQNG